jgi:hypothetical protein
MTRLTLAAAAILAGLGLQACSGSGLALMGADAASQVASGRTLTGNLIHAFTGKDCVPLNALAGRPMCQDDAQQTAEAKDAAPVYCYRTLGQVDCHSEPDPMMSPRSRLYRTEVAARPPADEPAIE